MDRRTLLLGTASGISLLAGCGSTGEPEPTTTNEETATGPTILVDEENTRVAEDRLENGQRLSVYPESNLAIKDEALLLVRFDEAAYAEPTNLAFTAGGYAAYSRVCTHQDCLVDGFAEGMFSCDCHGSEFDPTEGARVTDGPADRPLPQRPITITSDGYVAVTGDFDAPVGSN
jgi:rieske iron-sulfur protein